MPKFDPNEEIIVFVRARGGEVTPASTLAPKVGPMGLSPKKLGTQIATATKSWAGMKVTCKLTVKNRQAVVTVVPSASSLIIKELKEPKRDRKKVKGIKHDGNLTLNTVIDIAKKLRPNSRAREFKGTVKEILGTCVSIGCSVNGEDPKDITEQITDGSIPIKDPEDDEADE